MTRDGEVSQDGRLHGAGGRAASPLSKPGKDSRGKARHSWRAGSRRELWPGQTRQEVEDQKGLWPEDRALSREGTAYQQGKTGAMGFPKAARGGRHPGKPHFLNRDRLGIDRWACTLWPRKPTSLTPALTASFCSWRDPS